MVKPKATRFVGIDYGRARIGIAVSDERKIIAAPLLTLKAEKKMEESAASLAKVLQKDAAERGYTIEEIVIGLPLHMNGKPGIIADEVKQFVEMFRLVIDSPIVLWDERLTSVQAERSMVEANMTRKQRSQKADTVAAVIILQNYLDSKMFGSQDHVPLF